MEDYSFEFTIIRIKNFIGKHIYYKFKNKFNVNYLNKYFDEKDILNLNIDFYEKYFSKYLKIDIIINLVHIHKKSLKKSLVLIQN